MTVSVSSEVRSIDGIVICVGGEKICADCAGLVVFCTGSGLGGGGGGGGDR